MTPILSFSACLAENPGALKIENPEFSARNARNYRTRPDWLHCIRSRQYGFSRKEIRPIAPILHLTD